MDARGGVYTVEARSGGETGTVLATATSNMVAPFTPEQITGMKNNVTGATAPGSYEVPSDGTSGWHIGNAWYQYRFTTLAKQGENNDRTDLLVQEKTSPDGKNFSDWTTVTTLQDRRVEGSGFSLNPATGHVVGHAHLEKTSGYGYSAYLLVDIDPGTGKTTVFDGRPMGLDTKDQSFYIEGNDAYIVAAVHNNSDVAIIKLNASWNEPVEVTNIILKGKKRETPSIMLIDGTYYCFTSKASGWYPSQTMYASGETLDGEWTELREVGSASSYDAQYNYTYARGGEQHRTYSYVSWHWGSQRGSNSTPIGVQTREVVMAMHNGFIGGTWYDGLVYDNTYGTVGVQKGRNLSYGKTVTDTYYGTEGTAVLVDGDDRASAAYLSHDGKAKPYSVTVDLGDIKSVSGMNFSTRLVTGSETIYKYTIATSRDGRFFTTVFDGSDNKYCGFVPNRFDATARYVRLTVTDWPKINGGAYFEGINEITVYGGDSAGETGDDVPEGLTYYIDAGARGNTASAAYEQVVKAYGEFGASLANARADQSFTQASGWGSSGGAKVVTGEGEGAESTGLVATGRTLRYRLTLPAGTHVLTAQAAGFGTARAMSQTISWSGGKATGDVIMVDANGVAEGNVEFTLTKATTVTYTLTKTSGANPSLTRLMVQTA